MKNLVAMEAQFYALILHFHLVTSKSRYFEFRSLTFLRKIMIFRLEAFETSLENLMTFRRKVLRTKDEF